MEIIIDDKVVEKLAPESLPMLIHGKEGSGASLYTIALAAKWYELGYKILFLCGYKMAEEEFTKLVGDHEQANFFTQDEQEQFLDALQNLDDKTLVLVKNAELFDWSIYNNIATKLVVVSGDVSQSVDTQIAFTTQIYFSKLPGVTIPDLNKYEGFVVSQDFSGITQLKSDK